MKLNCENPQIILHPLAIERIVRYKNYTIKGHYTKCRLSKSNLYYANKKQFSPKSHFISQSDIVDCYITDHDTGEIFPLYLEVPCGKCDCCKSKKINAFVQRCELETQLYSCKPIFLTLTYNENAKPKNGLSVRDVQLFFKRLRINLYRQGYRSKIRYVCVGEYGRNTHRPHYHAILWNLRQTDILSYRRIGEEIQKAWPLGFEMHRLVDPSDNKSFYYTAKYMRKDCVVPDGCHPTFLCSSNRGGGIGSAYIDGIATELQRTLNPKPRYVNKWNGKVKELKLSKYVLDRVFPSLSQSLPAELKTAMRTLNLSYAVLAERKAPELSYFTESYEKFNHFFQTYIYCPDLKGEEIKEVFKASNQVLVRNAIEAEMCIGKYYSNGSAYYKQRVELSNKRDLMLSKLALASDDVTDDVVSLRAYNARRSFALAAQREVF